jgi:coenzyme F420-reducing hydrogenase gamma subunit
MRWIRIQMKTISLQKNASLPFTLFQHMHTALAQDLQSINFTKPDADVINTPTCLGPDPCGASAPDRAAKLQGYWHTT